MGCGIVSKRHGTVRLVVALGKVVEMILGGGG